MIGVGVMRMEGIYQRSCVTFQLCTVCATANLIEQLRALHFSCEQNTIYFLWFHATKHIFYNYCRRIEKLNQVRKESKAKLFKHIFHPVFLEFLTFMRSCRPAEKEWRELLCANEQLISHSSGWDFMQHFNSLGQHVHDPTRFFFRSQYDFARQCTHERNVNSLINRARGIYSFSLLSLIGFFSCTNERSSVDYRLVVGIPIPTKSAAGRWW